MTKLGGRIDAGTGGGWMERRPKPTDRHRIRRSAMELVALTHHSQKSPEKSRAVRVLDREKLEPIFASIWLLAPAKE
jgi:hypothetical protein